MDTNYDKENKQPPKMRIPLSGVSGYEANAYFNSRSFSEIVFKKLEVALMNQKTYRNLVFKFKDFLKNQRNKGRHGNLRKQCFPEL